MNRRRFLTQGSAAVAIAVGTGGLLFLRRNHARGEIASRMLDDALPPLSSNSFRELNALPARAREEIKRYFHGKCLNVEGFVRHICSHAFTERLGRCRTQEERESCFLHAFCARVATEAEIVNQVEVIASEAGSDLDSAWAGYCNDLCRRWNTRIQGCGSPMAVDDLSHRLDRLLRNELEQAARQATSTLQKPAIGQTIGKIGASAILLLPLGVVSVASAGPAIAVTANPLVIPVFFILAARHLWDYIASRLDDRSGEYQAVISGRLAVLGNRIGAELEREIRQRLTDLHTWQEQSIRTTATRLAEERVSLI